MVTRHVCECHGYRPPPLGRHGAACRTVRCRMAPHHHRHTDPQPPAAYTRWWASGQGGGGPGVVVGVACHAVQAAVRFRPCGEANQCQRRLPNALATSSE